VLDEFGPQISFNLELKRGVAGEYSGLERTVLEAVERRGLLATTIFSSFEDSVLLRLRRCAAAARIGVLVAWRAPAGWQERVRAVGAETVHFAASLVDAGVVAAAHAADLGVLAYTVDAERQMRRLLDFGVDGLFTNHPDRLRVLVGERFPIGE
jgi:glycerophosphoryl diester phosphodiesterase